MRARIAPNITSVAISSARVVVDVERPWQIATVGHIATLAEADRVRAPSHSRMIRARGSSATVGKLRAKPEGNGRLAPPRVRGSGYPDDVLHALAACVPGALRTPRRRISEVGSAAAHFGRSLFEEDGRDCCMGTCRGAYCLACVAHGRSCSVDDDCCSHSCTSGVCDCIPGGGVVVRSPSGVDCCSGVADPSDQTTCQSSLGAACTTSAGCDLGQRCAQGACCIATDSVFEWRLRVRAR